MQRKSKEHREWQSILVVHPVGLALAKKMKRKFGTPYMSYLSATAIPSRIYQSYKELFEILEKPLPENSWAGIKMQRSALRQQSQSLVEKHISAEIQRFATMNFTVF